MNTSIFSFIEIFILRSWWVVLFVLACCMLYEHAMHPKTLDYNRLLTHLNELKIEKDAALKLQEELLRQVNSQSDPAWIELVLMKGLGLVPDEHTKVFFQNHD